MASNRLDCIGDVRVVEFALILSRLRAGSLLAALKILQGGDVERGQLRVEASGGTPLARKSLSS